MPGGMLVGAGMLVGGVVGAAAVYGYMQVPSRLTSFGTISALCAVVDKRCRGCEWPDMQAVLTFCDTTLHFQQGCEAGG